jgi:hypothetical protein
MGTGEPREVSLGGPPGELVLNTSGDFLGATVGDRLEVRNLRDGASWHVTRPTGVQLLGLSSDGRWAAALRKLDEPISRTGSSYQLVAWRTFASSPRVTVELGPQRRVPGFECQVGMDQNVMRAGTVMVDLAKATVVQESKEDTGAPCGAIANATMRAMIDDRHLLVSDLYGVPLARLDHPARVRRAALADDGRRAVTLDERGVLRVWALTPRDLVAQACAERPQPLDDAMWTRELPATLTMDACGRPRAAVAASPP